MRENLKQYNITLLYYDDKNNYNFYAIIILF